MASKEPLPTFLIGVGRAGIEILEAVQENVPGEESAYFDYLAIDSNMEALNNSSIDNTLYLQTPNTFLDRKKRQYPYLTKDIEFGVKGAERQRPVGRFKLDNPDEPSFSDIFDSIHNDIRRFKTEHNTDLTQRKKHFNIILVNSLGGGTGSGTFPLLTAVIDSIAGNLGQNNSFVYFAGFGVIPEFEFDRGIKDLPGDDGRYYANSYAALRDLERLVEAGQEETLRLPIHSRRFGQDEGGTNDAIETAMEENGIPLENSPFNDYFLIGVNEDLIDGEQSIVGVERYDQVIDNRVAQSIYTLAKHGDDMENVSGESDTDSRVGTVVETEVSVPHDRLVEYHETKAEQESLESLLFADHDLSLEQNGNENKDLDVIKSLIREPSIVFETMEGSGEETKEELKDLIGSSLGGGLNLANRTPEDIDELLGEVEDRYDLRAIPYVLDVVESEIAEQEPTVRENREEIVSEMWSYYELSAHPEFGDAASISQKERNLHDYLNQEIEETRVELNEAEESFWDGKPGIEGTKEKLDKRLSDRTSALERLNEVRQNYERLQALDDEVTTRRAEIERRLKEKKRNLSDARESLEAMRRELAEPETGLRIAQLPLTDKAFEDAALDEIKNVLGSLKAYVENGYVDREVFLSAIARRYERCLADENRQVIDVADGADLDDDVVNQYTGQDTQAYIEYKPENEEILDFSKVQHAYTDFDRYSDDRYDPYTIKFAAFARAGPIRALRQYNVLQSYAEDGDLDSLVEQQWGGDHRLSFAYPEWYGREIQRYFNVETVVELPPAPEPTIENVLFDAEDEGELKHEFIKRNGVMSYLYQGCTWENYENQATDFRGWKSALEEVGVGWQYFQELSPSAEKKRQWLAGNVPWEELLESFLTELEDNEGIRAEFEEPTQATTD